MELTEIGVTAAKIKQFNHKDICSVEDLLTYYPRRYIDCSEETGLLPDNKLSCFLAIVTDVREYNNKTPMIIARCIETATGYNVNVMWFRQQYMYSRLLSLVGKEVYIAGIPVYDAQYNNYSVSSPFLFTEQIKEAKRIYPVYSKIRGMSDEYISGKMATALTHSELFGEIYPERIIRENRLMSSADTLKNLHNPSSAEALERAQDRIIFDDLFYFATQLEIAGRANSTASPYRVKCLDISKRVVPALPYSLTEDQRKTLRTLVGRACRGERINALVQGEVGSGKSIVSFLAMIAMADSGYQAVLMAPTQVLARQHYEELSELIAPYGLKAAFVGGNKMRKAERAALIDGLQTGEIDFLVGTHAVLNEDFNFKALSMVIVDEEHKFGVVQRNTLTSKSQEGIHFISMSATPIPRSLAQIIYGNGIQLCTIKTMPNGRLPVKTIVSSNQKAVFKFISNQIKEGRQAYVVCPMIDRNEDMEGVQSVEEVSELYNAALTPFGINIATVTGKTSKEDAEEIIKNFKENRIQVLIATTVIEVGVNVPNASTIVIHNAERFGLSGLHQLRGRVGRGKYQSYCVLFSAEESNARLNVMCSTNDGFRIAEEDLKLRGAGELIGIKQSGYDKYMQLMIAYSDRYEKIKEVAKQTLDSGEIDIIARNKKHSIF